MPQCNTMIEVIKLARVYFESTNPAKRGIDMQCGSCGEVIPSDSIFCPECGARQEMSRAGNLPGVGNVGLGGQQVQGGRNFGVVSGEAVMNQNMQQGMPNQGMPPGMMPSGTCTATCCPPIITTRLSPGFKPGGQVTAIG